MLYNKLVENIILPLGDIALDTKFMGTLRKWRKIQKMDEQTMREFEKDEFNNLLKHAVKEIPFYREQNITLTGNPTEDIKQFPIMYKKDIKANLDKLIDRNKKREDLISEKSSGSSGIQGEVLMTKAEQSAAAAIQTSMWEWSGYQLGSRLIQTGITPNRGTIKSIKDNLLRTDYVSAFGLSEEDIVKKLKELEKHPRDYFGGYASSLFVFASIALKNNIRGVRFKAAISWGDKLFDHYRKTIKEAFSCEITDTYGCTEGLMIGGQCEHGNFHIMSPHIHLELLDKEGNEVAPGELGYVVVTRLDNYSMPLIRYYLGDIAVRKPLDERCSCGRKTPLLEKVIGRDTDIVKTESGKYMVVHFFTGIFEHVPEIAQFRVIQKELAGMEIDYIPAHNFNEQVLRDIETKIHNFLNEPFPITFNKVDEIPPTKSGKPQIIQSFIK